MKLEILQLKNRNGLNISYFGNVNTLFEKYGILDRDSSFKEKIKNLCLIYTKQTQLYEKYYHKDIIKDLTEWLQELKIVVNYEGDYTAVFNVNDNFKLNTDKTKVLSATILLNPTNIFPDDLYHVLYHEIKHIYDYMIQKTDTILQENLFRDLIYKTEIDFTSYKKNFVEMLVDDVEIMNFIGNCLFYTEKSECSAYLENIDQDYLQTLNNNEIIFSLLYNGYKFEQIKSILRYNQATSNYISIYSVIYKYLTDLCNTDNTFYEINKEYKDTFKSIYNVTNLRAVLSIYLKRIDKLCNQADKLFTDRYENSLLQKLIENKL